jgi:hypothetical protein
MEKHFGLPVNFGFSRDLCVNKKRNRLLQRHLCQDNCFWNPQICFLEQEHSGNLVDLMNKSFHDTFNPAFASQFNRVYAGKIDWSLNGGVGNFPSFGLKKLIEDLGITSKIGPSGVRALPLAAGINEGGHYFSYFWSEQSVCAALGCWHKRRWPLL